MANPEVMSRGQAEISLCRLPYSLTSKAQKKKGCYMSRIKDENYFQVSGWMLNRLQLKGTELCVYAIIYGFTQDGDNWFDGSRQYLADFTGVSKTAIDNALARLVEKGLLVKNEVFQNSVKFNRYKVYPLQETCTPPKNFCEKPPKKLVHPLQETCTNNIDDITIFDNNKNNNINMSFSDDDFDPEEIFGTPAKPVDNSNQTVNNPGNITAELKQRINTLFHRRQSTTWTAKETATLRQIAKRNGVLDEMTDIEKLYNSGYEYRRRDIGTFLNNWAVELDRANNNQNNNRRSNDATAGSYGRYVPKH